MNKNLEKCLPYPFERLAALLAGITPASDKTPIKWSIGEPAHAAPDFVKAALTANLDGLSKYPLTAGSLELRLAIANWLEKRFSLPEGAVDPEKNVLPVSGTREALFSFAQAVVNGGADALVAMPNPFYQIYEGAAFLAGARPYFLNLTAVNGYLPDFAVVPDAVWEKVQLVYACSPSNPTGTCFGEAKWHEILGLSKRFGFVVAADECYCEIYLDESKPPTGLLAAARSFGLVNFEGVVVFHSLSKRSNLPGMRSGFVAGDASILDKYRLYRTYHGCAMPPPIQAASTAAWQDEEHVAINRELYRQKFDAVLDILQTHMEVCRPEAGFYLWPQLGRHVGIDDCQFARRLFADENLLVLPGSYISREVDGVSPGRGYLRMALVAPIEECIEGARRLCRFLSRAGGNTTSSF